MIPAVDQSARLFQLVENRLFVWMVESLGPHPTGYLGQYAPVRVLVSLRAQSRPEKLNAPFEVSISSLAFRERKAGQDHVRQFGDFAVESRVGDNKLGLLQSGRKLTVGVARAVPYQVDRLDQTGYDSVPKLHDAYSRRLRDFRVPDSGKALTVPLYVH